MLDILVQVVGELVLQVLAQALVELGLHATAAPFRRTPEPFLAAIGYALLGAICGGVSLLIFPVHLIGSGPWRVANLVVTPITSGVVLSGMGAWRARRGDPVLRIDRFAYAALFALALALVRFRFAHEARG